MRLPFLKHLVEAVTVLSNPHRIIVLGSSSLLVETPSLGEPGQPLDLAAAFLCLVAIVGRRAG